ncbi:MAG: Arabinose 5-phosphate isomerase KdsD [Candidatus Moanabacter tarae]|uniref:Arabinose 5-phosphate isomerase KdsD n=1 Tax=Candidatus Moanibacter tarae TaxID=2200854 RepID=A0A2Z4AQP8_9BACT|nr:MAG: Arabinose 5-phosphate isomerase KdsD [Candidatus Moanabacter tarae]|tara:strand:- start:11609 stop:12238 length:630 start_codon:yes stop_codon:yes gene_type:complete
MRDANRATGNSTVTRIIRAESEAISNIPEDNDFELALDLIYERVHRQNGKVITSGIGKAGHVALNLSSTFAATGTPATFLHPAEAQHGDLGLVHKNDILLLVSNSGKTRELLELVQLTRNLHADHPVMVITGNRESPLAKKAIVILYTGGPPEVCPLNLTPTSSITTMMVIGHILTILLMMKIEFPREAFYMRHHGGYLGSLAKAEKSD